MSKGVVLGHLVSNCGLEVDKAKMELLSIQARKLPWYAHIANYLVTSRISNGWTANEKKKNFKDIQFYFGEELELKLLQKFYNVIFLAYYV
ncbi:unnamed protein product [Spirodela intermedia]|uniref:Uncharacterized protein n=1 Tax=Spirodela intermedia TaxID=51605 RepID=A0A7I8I972_SPIIN|nr:unnamed protein product [Spirodela intermedia]CAA6654034.1 unnamed protein product [Spirodela intermedia]